MLLITDNDTGPSVTYMEPLLQLGKELTEEQSAKQRFDLVVYNSKSPGDLQKELEVPEELAGFPSEQWNKLSEILQRYRVWQSTDRTCNERMRRLIPFSLVIGVLPSICAVYDLFLFCDTDYFDFGLWLESRAVIPWILTSLCSGVITLIFAIRIYVVFEEEQESSRSKIVLPSIRKILQEVSSHLLSTTGYSAELLCKRSSYPFNNFFWRRHVEVAIRFSSEQKDEEQVCIVLL